MRNIWKNKIRLLTVAGVLIIGIVLIYGCEHNLIESETQIIKNITAKEAYELIQNNKVNENFIILDVRTPEEFAGEHIENAINLNYYSETFRADLNEFDKNKTYIIYCAGGARSSKVLSIMEEDSFREVYNMLGGIFQWKKEGYPLVGN